MRIVDFTRAATFKVAVLSALVFVAVLLAVLAVGRFVATTYWRADLESTVQSEQQRLLGVYEHKGLLGLKALVDISAHPIRDEGYLYYLEDGEGKKLSGQLETATPRNGLQYFAPPWLDSDEPFVIIGQKLRGGGFLLVGHDAHDLHEMEDLVGEGAVWIICLVLPLSLLAGIAASALLLRRLEGINQVALEIRSGNLRKRLPIKGTGDEFDRLSGHLNSMLDSIQDLTESLRQVSNEIAHQMRTPLTRIRGRLETARREPTSAEQLKEVLESISGELDALLGAFSSMLKIAQLDAGATRQGFRKFDLSELLLSIAQDFMPLAEAEGMMLRSRIKPNLEFFGDRRLITQMLVNLVENAISHSRASEIEIEAITQGSTAVVTIADNGIGIPAGEREHVFQRFYRLDTRPGSLSFGLGLSLVAAVAKLHHIGVALTDNHPGLKVALRFEPGQFPQSPERLAEDKSAATSSWIDRKQRASGSAT